tara:strand:- start:1186 stop:1806 length:621 start_codon:yes stop_codon:yes gene_type:complete
MLPIRYKFTPANADLTGFASNVTGASWTLTATAATDALAHRVSIKNDSATDHSAKTALLTGTDVDGHALTETVALPAGSATTESTSYFATLTSIVPSATISADTMDIGWVDEFISKTIGLDWRAGDTGLNVIVSGTINYTVQQTFNEIQTTDRTTINWMDQDDTSLVSATTNQNGNYIVGVIAARLVINSYSSGATIELNITQQNY